MWDCAAHWVIKCNLGVGGWGYETRQKKQKPNYVIDYSSLSVSPLIHLQLVQGVTTSLAI